VRLEADDVEGLRAGHAVVERALSTYGRLRLALVSVRWSGGLRTEAAVRAHLDFATRLAPKVSTWVPLCLPGAPDAARLGAFANPEDCAACVFYQGRACQGFGEDTEPFARLSGAVPALGPADGVLRGERAAVFDGTTPTAYWQPTRRAIAALGAAARAAGGTLWDLGGGNGFVAGLLARDEGLSVTVFDRVGAWPALPGVAHVAGDLRETSRGRAPPGAVLVSWPPTGDGFRDVLRALAPRVVAFAYDADGFCGRRRGHAGLVVTDGRAQWFRAAADDFGPLRGRPRRFLCAVRASRDASGAPSGGRFEVRSDRPFEVPEGLVPYPWE
jgi:hypothetical protein